MSTTLESLHETCATCHGRRFFVRSCPFCSDSGHDHECDDTQLPCGERVHLLVDQVTAEHEDAAKYRAAVAAVPDARDWARADYGGTGLSVADELLGKLGLTLDTPPAGPDTCPKCGHASHWEHATASRAPNSYCSQRDGWSSPNCGCVHRPPPGPGGGETKSPARYSTGDRGYTAGGAHMQRELLAELDGFVRLNALVLPPYIRERLASFKVYWMPPPTPEQEPSP